MELNVPLLICFSWIMKRHSPIFGKVPMPPSTRGWVTSPCQDNSLYTCRPNSVCVLDCVWKWEGIAWVYSLPCSPSTFPPTPHISQSRTHRHRDYGIASCCAINEAEVIGVCTLSSYITPSEQLWLRVESSPLSVSLVLSRWTSFSFSHSLAVFCCGFLPISSLAHRLSLSSLRPQFNLLIRWLIHSAGLSLCGSLMTSWAGSSLISKVWTNRKEMMQLLFDD